MIRSYVTGTRLICLNLAFFFLNLLISYEALCQSKLKGTVVDVNTKPIANASVSLLNARDSSLFKGSITTKDGNYSFEKVPPGNYLVSCSNVGYTEVSSQVFSIAEGKNEIDLDILKLSQKTDELGRVTVTAKKPLFEQKIDRIVINVANNITAAGSTALDVLERSPGVLVDRHNNAISINGKDGVVVMINGKISRMPISAVMQMLAGMPADNIERIELITTPPANFDAEGNAGFINIVLKANTQLGTNGSYSITAGYANEEVTLGTFNFNHRKGKVNVYGDYTFNRANKDQIVSFYHAVNYQGRFSENFSESRRDPRENIHDLRIGIDYELKKKTILGALLTVYDRRWKMTANNIGTIHTNHSLDTSIYIFLDELHTLKSYDINLNLQRSLREGEKIMVNLDYMYYNDVNPVYYLNSYYKGDGSFLYDQELKSSKNTPIDFFVGTIDYTKNLGKGLDLEAGIKGTISLFTNDVMVARQEPGGWVTDDEITALYNLEENISAAYSSLSWGVNSKTSMKLGFRYEYTNSNLGSVRQKNIVDKHYGNLFPSYFISHTINEQNAFNFSYSKRVTRPTFWNMAPFVIFMDPNTYFSGNPGLQPAISDNLNAAYIFKKKILSVSYSHEKRTITNFSPQVDPVTNKQTLAAENQKNSNNLSFNLSIPVEFTKWWSMQANFSAGFQQLNGIYKSEPLSIEQKNFLISASQNFKLAKDLSVSVSGFYRSAGLFNIYKAKAFGSLDLGLQKKFRDQRSTLRFNGGNILNSNIRNLEINLPEKNLVVFGKLHLLYPSYRVTFTRSFGNDKLKTKRNRSTGTEAEKERLKQ